MTDPTASIWEVTRLILGTPGSSPSEIAHAHGFSTAEVAELLPIFFENLQANYSHAAGGAPPGPPEPRPDESAEDHAARYLSELSENIGGHVEVVSYESFGTPVLDPAGIDPSFEDASDGTIDPQRLMTPDENGSEAEAVDTSFGSFGSGEPGGSAAADRALEPDHVGPEAASRMDAGEDPYGPDEQLPADEDDLPDTAGHPEPDDLSGNAFQFD